MNTNERKLCISVITKTHIFTKKKMEKEFKFIDIKLLKEYSQQNSYTTDDYLFITDKLNNILTGENTIKLKVFLMIYCIKGELSLEMNTATYSLKEDDLLVCLPNTLLGKIMTSPNYQVKILCFSSRFIQRLTQTEKYTWKAFHHLHRNPVKHFNDKEKESFNRYLTMIENKNISDADYHQKEILLYLSLAFFTELVAAVCRKTTKTTDNIYINQPNLIFKRFIEEVIADNGRHRTLEYYANQCCYSPKYLSRVIKRISGKNALTLIHENAIEHIIHELKYSSMSIKEIAIAFEFSNISYFAQYVKKYLGVTPSKFRENLLSVQNSIQSETSGIKDISEKFRVTKI